MRAPGQTRTRAAIAAVASLTLGLALVSIALGPSGPAVVRALQALAVFVAGAVAFLLVVVIVVTHLAHWSQPEAEFETIVQRAERLGARWSAAGEGTAPAEAPGEFGALVRAAIDELPLEMHRALEHVAIVVGEGGIERGAYGLYEGDTVARDYFHDRIVIFRDSLTRDFGHDPDLLRCQVARTLRHELAHHLGWGERGVRGLGL
ncbi:MAG TPA: metallopeptidase family protein [Solirubrobacteraceae bacterium]|nr:metallopeptidase family protein [Solirubrobacteraceae bacterium]